MKLRTRILLGYWYLVALLVVSAVAAALGFHRLGSDIGTVLDENFESVRASMLMLDALERQDSAVLASLLGEEGAPAAMSASEAAFTEAVSRARGNVTLAEESPVLDEIERRYAAFRQARDRLLSEPGERPLRAYETESFPLFGAVKDKVFELLDLNHRAMVEADVRAQHAARLSAMGYGLLVLIALLSLAVLSQALGHVVLDRLTDLGTVARAIAAGDRRRRATPVHPDELGVVAEQLNAVLDRLAEVEGSAEGRLGQERQLSLALLGEIGAPAAVVSLSGAVVASSLPPERSGALERAARQLPAGRLGDKPPGFTVDLSDLGLRCRLLRNGPARVVGWLVEEASSGS